MFDDTIAAIATPLGEGGLAVIRVSGMKAFEIADQCFRASSSKSEPPSALKSHTLHHGHIIRGDAVVDEVLLAVMRAPRTYTCENTIEISCHGGLLPAKAVLDTMLAAGARMAMPGEFTRRAFLNGRLDLAQAEAVADLIHSDGTFAARRRGATRGQTFPAHQPAPRRSHQNARAHRGAHRFSRRRHRARHARQTG